MWELAAFALSSSAFVLHTALVVFGFHASPGLACFLLLSAKHSCVIERFRNLKYDV
jgi:hypothetical protein